MKMFQLRWPSWLENIHMFCLVNNLPWILCFQSFNLSNSCFPVFICKGTTHSSPPILIILIACSSHCFQEVYNEICASTIATNICRGRGLSMNSSIEGTSNAITFIVISWAVLLWTESASILFPFKISQFSYLGKWNIRVVQPSELAIILARPLSFLSCTLLVLTRMAFVMISLWTN